MKTILLLSGSLRKDSINTALLRACESATKKDVRFIWADPRIPLYNEELEEDFPEEAHKLRDAILSADGVILASPEYNRGMSGVMKNAIDWASRPYGDNAWEGKIILAASASPGSIAGALAVYQMKQSLLHLNAQVMGQPEVMVGGAFEKFNDAGELTDMETKKFIKSAVDTLIEKISS